MRLMIYTHSIINEVYHRVSMYCPIKEDMVWYGMVEDKSEKMDK